MGRPFIYFFAPDNSDRKYLSADEEDRDICWHLTLNKK